MEMSSDNGQPIDYDIDVDLPDNVEQQNNEEDQNMDGIDNDGVFDNEMGDGNYNDFDQDNEDQELQDVPDEEPEQDVDITDDISTTFNPPNDMQHAQEGYSETPATDLSENVSRLGDYEDSNATEAQTVEYSENVSQHGDYMHSYARERQTTELSPHNSHGNDGPSGQIQYQTLDKLNENDDKNADEAHTTEQSIQQEYSTHAEANQENSSEVLASTVRAHANAEEDPGATVAPTQENNKEKSSATCVDKQETGSLQTTDQPHQVGELNHTENDTMEFPIVLTFGNISSYLFPLSTQDEENSGYFLADKSLIGQPIKAVFDAFRDKFHEGIGQNSELGVEITDLDIFLGEESSYSSSAGCSLSSFVEVYIKLCQNDGIEDMEPLHLNLTVQETFYARWAQLRDAAAEGKGLSDVVQHTYEDESHEGSHDEPDEEDGHEEGEDQDQESRPAADLENEPVHEDFGDEQYEESAEHYDEEAEEASEVVENGTSSVAGGDSTESGVTATGIGSDGVKKVDANHTEPLQSSAADAGESSGQSSLSSSYSLIPAEEEEDFQDLLDYGTDDDLEAPKDASQQIPVEPTGELPPEDEEEEDLIDYSSDEEEEKEGAKDPAQAQESALKGILSTQSDHRNAKHVSFKEHKTSNDDPTTAENTSESVKSIESYNNEEDDIIDFSDEEDHSATVPNTANSLAAESQTSNNAESDPEPPLEDTSAFNADVKPDDDEGDFEINIDLESSTGDPSKTRSPAKNNQHPELGSPTGQKRTHEQIEEEDLIDFGFDGSSSPKRVKAT